ncbi:MAG: arginine--tRNA ligase [Minisyncoccia bacterium]
MIIKQLEKLLKQVINENIKIQVFYSENKNFGDYNTNIALKLAPLYHKDPLIIAKEIVDKISNKNIFEKIEVVPPGFINFYLNLQFLQKNFYQIFQPQIFKKKNKIKISIDYLDVNPTGPVHIGHGRSGFFGDVLSRLLKFYGYKISREFYVNNAKTSGQIRSLGKTVLGYGKEYKTKELLELLKNKKVKAKIKQFKKLPPEQAEQEAGFYIAKIIHKKNKEFLSKKAKINFDLFFEEQTIYNKNLIDDIINKLKKKKVVYLKNKAVWFAASKFGDNEDRVLIRTNGMPTYFAADIVYHYNRLIVRKFKKIIDIFGADHFGYGPRIKGAMFAFNIKPQQIDILYAQTVNFKKSGKLFKMSKRKGIYIKLEDLIDDIGLDAARFFFLSNALDSHFDFDIDLAKQKALNNPVFYVQYAYVRAVNILKGANIIPNKKLLKYLTTDSDKNLMKKILQFYEIIELTVNDYQLQRLTKYAIELSKEFHNFYEKERVKGEDEKLQQSRLLLVKGFITVMGFLFDILGIQKLKKM